MKLSTFCDCVYCYNKDCPCSCHAAAIQSGEDEPYGIGYWIAFVVLLGLTLPFALMWFFSGR